MGSNPIARSSIANGWQHGRNKPLLPAKWFIIYTFGDVAKWQGKGLQNPHHRFKSDRRLYNPIKLRPHGQNNRPEV